MRYSVRWPCAALSSTGPPVLSAASCCFCPRNNQSPSCATQLSSTGPSVLLAEIKCCFWPRNNQLPSCAKQLSIVNLSSTIHRSAPVRPAWSAGAFRRKVLFLSANKSIAKQYLSSTGPPAHSAEKCCLCPRNNQLPSCAKRLSSTGPPVRRTSAGAFRSTVLFLSTKKSIAKLRQAAKHIDS